MIASPKSIAKAHLRGRFIGQTRPCLALGIAKSDGEKKVTLSFTEKFKAWAHSAFNPISNLPLRGGVAVDGLVDLRMGNQFRIGSFLAIASFNCGELFLIGVSQQLLGAPSRIPRGS